MTTCWSTSTTCSRGGWSEELATQARDNTKAQFANSPTLRNEMMNAIIDAMAAHQVMRKEALDSQRVRGDG
nr:hypothetical protein [Brevundimonas naejangsanensis]